jgi:hypothetical protein
MKISEAEKLICPFIQHICLATGVAPFNTTEYSHLNISCITDKCMAWGMTKTYSIGGYSKEVDEDGNGIQSSISAVCNGKRNKHKGFI